MTTTVGIKGKDFIVLAADQRATMGSFIANADAQKIHMLAPHIGFTIAGGVGDAQALIRALKSEAALYELKNKRPISVAGMNTLAANIMFSAGGNLQVHPIIAGVDRNGPRMFTMDSVGGYGEEANFCSTGSGSPGALGLLEDSYDPEMSETAAVALAKRAILTAQKRDAGSGSEPKVVVIK
jgi:proteasome beta subunit